MRQLVRLAYHRDNQNLLTFVIKGYPNTLSYEPGTGLLTAPTFEEKYLMEDAKEASSLGDLPHFLAVFKRDMPFLQEYVNEGGDINEPEKWNGTTLLMQSTYIGDIEITKFLLKNHANVNQLDCHKQTALMFATLNVSPNIISS